MIADRKRILVAVIASIAVMTVAQDLYAQRQGEGEVVRRRRQQGQDSGQQAQATATPQPQATRDRGQLREQLQQRVQQQQATPAGGQQQGQGGRDRGQLREQLLQQRGQQQKDATPAGLQQSGSAGSDAKSRIKGLTTTGSGQGAATDDTGAAGRLGSRDRAPRVTPSVGQGSTTERTGGRLGTRDLGKVKVTPGAEATAASDQTGFAGRDRLGGRDTGRIKGTPGAGQGTEGQTGLAGRDRDKGNLKIRQTPGAEQAPEGQTGLVGRDREKGNLKIRQTPGAEQATEGQTGLVGRDRGNLKGRQTPTATGLSQEGKREGGRIGRGTPAAGAVEGQEGLATGTGRDRIKGGRLPAGLQQAGQTPGFEAGPGLKKGAVRERIETPAATRAERMEQHRAATDRIMERRSQFAGDTGKLSMVAPREKAALIGANIDPDKFGKVMDRRNFLTADNALAQMPNLDRRRPGVELTENQLSTLRRGELPHDMAMPRGEFGRMRRPIEINNINIVNINNTNINIQNNYFLPPPPPRGGGMFDFTWNYWDGRCYYDQGYAMSTFINIGHSRYGGYDGCVVSGRYYCYGYGWMDGCIDYGECRVWVPGFWAPYTVEECCSCQVWIPPQYEEVWTGCCWETVQVGGGYFDESPDANCHMVTHYSWVPGHYEFYNA